MTKQRTIVMAVGGTGGHLYPAQSVASELIQSGMDIKFMGLGLNTSSFFDRTQFAYEEICSATLSFRQWYKLPNNLMKLVIGMIKSVRSFMNNRPVLVIGFGSYHSFPILCAAYLMRIPYILFEANAILGKVNRLFAKSAFMNVCELFDIHNPPVDIVKATLPKTKVRSEKIEKTKALDYFGLTSGVPTVLIFGGSQGSVSINQIAIKALVELKQRGMEIQVIHLIGSNMSVEEVLAIYKQSRISAAVKQYEPYMAQGYNAADLLVCRAGASTVIEQVHYGVPAIFIPYPYLKDDHQTYNASYVVDQLQGGKIASQRGLTPSILAHHIQTIFEPKTYSSMQEALAAGKRTSTDRAFTEMVLEKVEELCK